MAFATHGIGEHALETGVFSNDKDPGGHLVAMLTATDLTTASSEVPRSEERKSLTACFQLEAGGAPGAAGGGPGGPWRSPPIEPIEAESGVIGASGPAIVLAAANPRST